MFKAVIHMCACVCTHSHHFLHRSPSKNVEWTTSISWKLVIIENKQVFTCLHYVEWSDPVVNKKKILNTETSQLINEEGRIELDYSSLPSLMK